MPRFRIGDTVFLDGQPAKVVWLSENANEIEPMDEYIVEFENKQRQFAISGKLTAQKPQAVYNREHDRGGCHDQTY
jgi:hypothetical protein